MSSSFNISTNGGTVNMSAGGDQVAGNKAGQVLRPKGLAARQEAGDLLRDLLSDVPELYRKVKNGVLYEDTDDVVAAVKAHFREKPVKGHLILELAEILWG